jgi:hypothetical protein
MSAQPSAKNFAVIVRLDRTIQYAAACPSISGAGDYWMPAFAGMTMKASRGRQ